METREVIQEVILHLKNEGEIINIATVCRYLMDIYICNLSDAWSMLKTNKDLL